MNKKRPKLLPLLLALCLLMGSALPQARAAEAAMTAPTIQETLPAETAAPETEPVQTTEEAVTIPEETEAPTETAAPETIPTIPQETAEAETAPTLPDDADDEWLYTLTDTPAPSEAPPAEPERSAFAQAVAETRLEFLLVSLVFAVFGAGTCWFGGKLGGAKFLLRFYGIRTEGTISQVTWDAWNRAYRCTISYRLENGRRMDVHWPVLQHGLRIPKLEGKPCTVFYNPKNPRIYHCTVFPMGSLFGTFVMLMGVLLLVAALIVAGFVLFV